MKIVHKPSPHFNDRPDNAPIDMIVIHAIGLDLETSLEILTGKSWAVEKYGKVSSHYLIDHDGTINKIVNEEKRAWHAGISTYDGRENLNDYSIGIELLNKDPLRDESFQADFKEAQINALIDLIKDIQTRHPINPDYIVGHSDIAPGRKTDPGSKFPWERLKNAIA